MMELQEGNCKVHAKFQTLPVYAVFEILNNIYVKLSNLDSQNALKVGGGEVRTATIRLNDKVLLSTANVTINVTH